MNKPDSPVADTKHKEQSSRREQKHQSTITDKPIWQRTIALATRAAKYCGNNAINNATRAGNLIINNRYSLVYKGALTMWFGSQVTLGQPDCLPMAANTIAYQFGNLVRLSYCGDYLYSIGANSQSKFYNQSYQWHDEMPKHEAELDEDDAEHRYICQQHRSVVITVKVEQEEYSVRVLVLKDDLINPGRSQFEVSHPLPETLRRELALQVANLITENARNTFHLETSKNRDCAEAGSPDDVLQRCNGVSALPADITQTGDIHLMSCPDGQIASPLCSFNTTSAEPVYQQGFDLYKGDNLAFSATGICHQKASVEVMQDGEVLASSHFPGDASQCFLENTVLPETRAFVKDLSHVNQEDINSICADFYGRDHVATDLGPCSHRVMPSSDVNIFSPSAREDDVRCHLEPPTSPSETASATTDKRQSPQEPTTDKPPSTDNGISLTPATIGIGLGILGVVAIGTGILGYALHGVKCAVNNRYRSSDSDSDSAREAQTFV
nr:hypothetical protein [Endozoicomonas sp.]